MQQEKKVDAELSIELPHNHGGELTLRLCPDGTMMLLDKHGAIVQPKSVARTVSHHREKGPKVRTRVESAASVGSFQGLHELAQLDHFIVVDTNRRTIAGTDICVAFFLAVQLRVVDGRYALRSLDDLGHAYEFQGVQGNAELLAILRIAWDITQNSGGVPPRVPVGFVTDSELGRHSEINRRTAPIFGEHLLPEGFVVMYASGDTGREPTNALVRFCDQQSTKLLQEFEAHGLGPGDQQIQQHVPGVTWRYRKYRDLKILNPVLDEPLRLTERSSVAVNFQG